MSRIAVVIPAFRVATLLPGVISKMPPYVEKIYVVDDACPDHSGARLQTVVNDPRLEVITNPENLGVGGAVKVGFRRATEAGYDIVAKLDGDGQMDPSRLGELLIPLISGEADMVKANRFFSASSFRGMPFIRLVGNAGLSFLNKFASGYWSISDPTNGYLALRAKALTSIDLDRLHNRYFFECDLLYRASLEQLVVRDVPLEAVYGGESSNLSTIKSLAVFPWLLLWNFVKRVFYRYYVREWSPGSFELPLGLGLFSYGFVFGIQQYSASIDAGRSVTAGQATFSALTLILGLQLLLAFLSGDVSTEPKNARFHRELETEGNT